MYTYSTINLDTGKDHGRYDTVEEARGAVVFDRLTNWAIYNDFTGALADASSNYDTRTDVPARTGPHGTRNP